MNAIEQNNDGDIFAIPYQDNGEFAVLILDKNGTEIELLKLNEKLSLNNRSVPIIGFNEPIITCCFLSNSMLFIQVYHRIVKKQYHFTYDF